MRRRVPAGKSAGCTNLGVSACPTSSGATAMWSSLASPLARPLLKSRSSTCSDHKLQRATTGLNCHRSSRRRHSRASLPLAARPGTALTTEDEGAGEGAAAEDFDACEVDFAPNRAVGLSTVPPRAKTVTWRAVSGLATARQDGHPQGPRRNRILHAQSTRTPTDGHGEICGHPPLRHSWAILDFGGGSATRLAATTLQPTASIENDCVSTMTIAAREHRQLWSSGHSGCPPPRSRASAVIRDSWNSLAIRV